MNRSIRIPIWITAIALVLAIGLPTQGSAAGPARGAEGAPGDWSQGRFDAAHSGTNPFEQVLGRETVPGLHPVWRAKTGAEGFLAIGSSPAVVDGVVYTGAYRGLFAFDADTGSPVWTTLTAGEDFSDSAPAVVDGRLFMTSSFGGVFAYGAATGAEVWATDTGHLYLSSPTLAGGIVYVASQEGSMVALDAADGSPVWERDLAAFLLGGPAVSGGMLYVGSTTKRLFALDAATGTTLWSVGPGAGINSSAAVVDGVLYVGSHDHVVHAYDAETGGELWHASTRRHPPSGVAVDGGSVYVTTSSVQDEPHEVLSLDAVTGRKRWTVTVDQPLVYPPVVANGIVYVTAWYDRLYAIDAERGAILYESEVQSNGGHVTPSISDGMVYAPNGDDFRLWAFEGSQP